MVNNKINFESLFEKLLLNDKDGLIVNELIEQKILNITDVNSYVVASNNFDYLYFFGKYVKYADIEKIENKVIEMNNVKNIYTFFKDIKISNLDKFQRVIIKIKNAEYIYKFACKIPDANIKLLEDAIIETENAEYIYKFAINIEGADINFLGSRLIEIDDVLFITDFALSLYKKIDEGLMNKIVDKLIKLGDDRALVRVFIFTEFAREKIVDALIEIGNARSLYNISYYLYDLDIDFDKFANGVIKTNDAICISNFFSLNSEKLSSSMCEKIENVLINIGDKDSLDSYYRYKRYNNENVKCESNIKEKKGLMRFLKK